MKLYAVIDTNVLVSALMKWDSIPGQVLQRTYAEQIFPDPDDFIFFEVAMESGKTNETYLVTGNIKHFPQHPRIVTPAQILNILDECE